MKVARLALLAIALAACAWFALGVREDNQVARVTAVTSRGLSLKPNQARAAEGLLADARILNPDQGLDMLRAELKARGGDQRGALRVAEAVVRREPQNVAGWLLLEYLTNSTDPGLNRLAHARLRALAPPVSPGP